MSYKIRIKFKGDKRRITYPVVSQKALLKVFEEIRLGRKSNSEAKIKLEPDKRNQGLFFDHKEVQYIEYWNNGD